MSDTIPEPIMANTPWTPVPMLEDESRVVKCETCKQYGPTKLEYDSGLATWMSCCGLSLIGCTLGCCLIPFCLNKTKDVRHRCSQCNMVLNRYERL